MTRAVSSRGLTLIELVVAMAVFALVAIMGLQSLTGSLTMRDRLTARAGQTEQLGLGLALLRNDLSAAIPMFFFAPGEPRPHSALTARRDGTGFSLSIGGQPGMDAPAGGKDTTHRQRVSWRIEPDGQGLIRQSWPTLYPVDASQQGPEIPVLEGVTALSLRSYWIGHGWAEGVLPPRDEAQSAPAGASDGDQTGAAPETYSNTLPGALELTLQTREFGEVVLMEYFQ